MSRDDQISHGKAVRTSLGQTPAATEPAPGFDDFMAELEFAGIWERPHLAKPDRAICTLAALSVLQRLDALKGMTATALDLGLTPRNIVEVFVQVGLYAGFVTTRSSAAVAHAVFAARKLGVPPEAARAGSLDELDRIGHEVMAKLHGTRARQGYAAPGNTITACATAAEDCVVTKPA